MLKRVFLVLALLLASARAHAAVESELIQQGIAAYEDLEYPKAIELLHRALRETLTRDEKVVVYKTLGFCHAAAGQMDAARVDFENLLRTHRGFELDRTVAPRVRAVFEQAKAAVATGRATSGTAALAIVPDVTPRIDPLRPKQGQPVQVAVELATGAEKLVLFHRTRGQDAYSRIEVPGDKGQFGVTIPGLAIRPPALEYYVELTDDADVVVAKGGSLGQPLDVPVTAKKTPLYKKGWFWGVIGGIAAAGAVAGLVVVFTRPSIRSDTPAAVTIQPF